MTSPCIKTALEFLILPLALGLTSCGGGNDDEEESAKGPPEDPVERRCGDFLSRAEAESIGMTADNYDEDEFEDNASTGLVCDGLDEGTFSVFMGQWYDVLKGGASDEVEDNAYGAQSFTYELFGYTNVGFLTENGHYAILVTAEDEVREEMIQIILEHAEAR